MENIFLIIHILSALALIGFILIQQGKGAETGASFGSGASQTFFGSQGSGSFLSRLTAILATLFFASSLILTILSHQHTKTKSIDEILNKSSSKDLIQPSTEKETGKNVQPDKNIQHNTQSNVQKSSPANPDLSIPEE